MPVMGKRTMIGGATVAVLLAMAVHDARWGPPACNSEAWAFPIKPKMIFGLSIGFGPWAKAAFPVGSCEADLVAWMDRVGFGLQEKSYWGVLEAESHDSSLVEARSEARRADNTPIKRRVFRQTAIVGSSYFEVSWDADQSGRIVEFYARSTVLSLQIFNLP